MMVTLSEAVDLLHGWYPPSTADSWDAVGLVAGDPDQEVRKVLFAVDPAPAVAREAAEWGADLLVVHHPLFLKPVHGVARTTPKARTLGTLLDAGCALLTAHTNADQAGGPGENRYLFVSASFDESLVTAPPKPANRDFEGKEESALTEEDKTNRSLDQAYKQWEENVKKGKETAEALSKRFAPWYYVISASSFDKIHLNRGDLVKRKET